MRTGTTYKLNRFSTFNLEAGALDKYNPKSIFFAVSGHFKTEEENPQQIIRGMVYKIKRNVSDKLYDSPFMQRHIANVIYPESVSWTGKCFFEIEFTLFYKDKPTEKPNVWLNGIGKMLEDIDFNNEKYQVFNRRKNKRKY